MTGGDLDLREIEQFLYREAALLDGRRYEEWLEFFTEDATYWMPAVQDDGDPERETSLIYDDRKGLGDRVRRLLHPSAHSQNPPSRTRHLITNVCIEEFDNGGVRCYANFIVMESRLGNQRTFGGHYEYQLRRGSDGWRIASKKVCLINNDGTLYYNLAFMF
jgi:benzoate/toluate 1,2-dioxygenase beta subunit